MKKTQKQPIKSTNKTNNNFLHLSNQEYLIYSLKLLGVADSEFEKHTKSAFTPNNLVPTSNPTASKAFFFITFTCLKHLVNDEGLEPLKMWYPPRTVNEQFEYKKVLMKIIQHLQIQGKIPKNLIVSKSVMMEGGGLVQFLRILAEMALRNVYLEKYSKADRLIQISLTQKQPRNQKQNDINRFYMYPFVPTKTHSEPPIADCSQVKQTFNLYIQMYINKIIKLRTKGYQNNLGSFHQELIANVVQQKQLAQKLESKIPRKMLSENRAFDRRRIIDRHKEIWDQLGKIQCHQVKSSEVPILKIEGEVDKLIGAWEPPNFSKLKDLNAHTQNIIKMKKEVHKALEAYHEIKKKIMVQIQK